MPRAPAWRATSESSDVAKLVRLHHRRRGWARVAIGSLIGLVVYAGIGVNPSWRGATRRRGEASGYPCPLAQIRAESTEHILPLAATTEAAFVAVHAVGGVGADDFG